MQLVVHHLIVIASISAALGQEVAKEQTSPVQIQTSVEGYTYCQNDDETDSVKISLRFTLKALTRPVLYLPSAERVSAVFAAATAEDLVAQRPLFELEASSYTGNTPRDLKASLFVRLAPGRSHEFTEAVTVIAARAGVRKPGFLHPGEYSLRVEVVPFDAPRRVREQLRKSLAPLGMLWEDPTFTVAMTFKILETRDAPRCVPR